jgi:hypothetical protein
MIRRTLLTAAAPAVVVLSSAAAAAAAPAVASPDAELIALCTRYVALDREYCGVGQHTWDLPFSDPEYIRCEKIACALVPGMHALEDRIADTPARTVHGLLAKAEAARHQLSGDADRDTGPMDPENALAWSLIEETLAVLGRA